MTISKNQTTDKLFEIIELTIDDIYQKKDFVDLKSQIIQINEEFQELNQVNNETFSEGLKKSITTTYYERNPKARNKCLEYWGFN